ncbi:MAG: Right origin-binding protein [Luteibacter sp.]|uniref:AraC family transcriptional regulator n=1 Tax=Luteibacter sp. TaxID=1886636 RepID=UPI00137FF689|nr:AraC family transcriptional regulator [Luteibacter sp.]KAF1004545.1 MAG: Right origin-binding protein [Luteibacter sp.]
MAVVQKAVWYIESHSGEALALADVARAVGVSPYHLARVFQSVTGCPVVRYLRARRLSEAARQLADGARDILSVALAAGYGSHEAFTRAFREQFGRTPEDVRQHGLGNVTLVEAIRVMQDAPPEAQVPRVVDAGPLLLAGLAARYRGTDTAGIPAQWQRFEMGLSPSRRTRYAYGVCFNNDDDGNFDYLAAYEVASFTGARTDDTRLRLPRRRYAVVRHHGHVGSIPQTWRALMQSWLPAAGLIAADAPEFERYDEAFDPATGRGGVEIWVPLD